LTPPPSPEADSPAPAHAGGPVADADDARRTGVFLAWAAVSGGLLAGGLVRPFNGLVLLAHVGLTALWVAAPALVRSVAAERRDSAVASLLLAAAPLFGAAAALSDGTASPDFVCLFAIPLTAAVLLPEARDAVALIGLLGLALGEGLLWTAGARLSTSVLWAVALVGGSLAARRIAHAVRPPASSAGAEAVRGQEEQVARRSAHSERLALLGRFAAGVAHDISNPLTYLSTNLQLLEREADALQEVSRRDVRAAVAESARAVDRITEVLRDLRRFARSEGVGAPQPTEVRPLVEEALQQAATRLRGIQVERALGEPLPQVTVRRRRLVQVLGNLLLNAADAVAAPEAKQRRIRVGAHAAADTVSIWVEDSGPGLSPEVLAHLFEPFFTTKPVGKGTGLGLALSREYVEADGGTLNLEAAPGGGTRAVVTLPRAPGASLAVTDSDRVA